MTKYKFKSKEEYYDYLVSSERAFAVLLTKVKNGRVTPDKCMEEMLDIKNDLISAKAYAIDKGYITVVTSI